MFSSAKRVTLVKSAGGYKASTVIWEVNFNQIFSEFGALWTEHELHNASNLSSQLRILTAGEHAKVSSAVCVCVRNEYW